MPDRWGQAHGITPPPLVMTQIDEIG